MIATVIGRAALRTRMRDAKISGMVDQIGIPVFGNMAAAGTLALLIWDKTDPRRLITWLLAISLLTTWRIYIHRRIKTKLRIGRSPTG